MQGAQILRSEAYSRYVATTKDEAQHRRWTFYEAVKLVHGQKSQRGTSISMRLTKALQMPGKKMHPDIIFSFP
jgi:hypothetical protein